MFRASSLPALLVAVAAPGWSGDAYCQSSSDAELAKKLSNPVASLISVPFQSNFDFGGGFDDDGFRYALNVQPVIPIALSEHWNPISRTILPVVYQKDILPPEVSAHDVDENDDDTTRDAWTFTAQTEATRNWEADEDKWTVPIGAFVSKVVGISGQKVSLQGGQRWYAVGRDTAPDWGLRFNATLLFPR